MDNKYLTTEQIKIIVEGAPKGVDRAALVDKIAAKGYVIQGFNDQEYEKQKAQKGYVERVGTDITRRMQDVAKPIETAIETAKDTNISPLMRTVGTLAEAGKVPLRAVGAGYGAVGDVIGEGINTLTGDTEIKPKEQVSEEMRTAYDIGNVLGGEVITGVAKPLTKAVAKQVSKLNVTTPNLKASIGSFVDDKIKKETAQLLTSTRSLKKATDNLVQRGINVNEIVSDPTIFKGIKVSNNKIDTTEATQVLDDRIEQLVSAKKSLLPEFDRLVAPQSKEVLRQRAYEDIAGKFTPADEEVLKKAIDSQIDALPNDLKVSDIDALRAKFRTSARNAKGLQKSSSEYSALENAARDTVFDITDNLPVANATEYKALNDTIKQWIGTKDFLEETLAGQTVKGGRLQNYTARGIGAIAGSQAGPLQAILGAEAGGAISNIIINNQLGSSMKMKLIKEITTDPEIIKQAEKLVQQAKNTNLLMLPSPTSKVRSSVSSSKTIKLPKEGSDIRKFTETK